MKKTPMCPSPLNTSALATFFVPAVEFKPESDYSAKRKKAVP
jgi:hypothetical protein